MDYRRIAVAVALQRYVDAPPVALRQRDLAAALAKWSGASDIFILGVEAPVAYAPSAETLAQKLEAFAAPLRAPGLAVDVAVRTGTPVAAVLAWLHEVAADVLIIGSHSKQSPLDVAMGSTASQLAARSPVSTVLVRPTPAEVDAAKAMMIPHYPWIIAYV